ETRGCGECTAPQALVSEMLQRLESSALEDARPNPSVLLALNLAGSSSRPAKKLLLQQLKEEAVERAHKGMASGQVALLVLALLSSCQDPQQVQALGLSTDLLRILQQATDEEMANLEVEGVPKTTLYSLGLDALSLCLAGVGGYQEPSVELAKELLSPSTPLSVDTRAMAVLALVCTYGRTDLHDVRDLLQEALSVVTNSFLDEQEASGGLIGNIYSMGLAMQALESAGRFYAPRQWDCSQALSAVSEHHFQLGCGTHGDHSLALWRGCRMGTVPHSSPITAPQGSVSTSRRTGSTSRLCSAPTEPTDGPTTGQ
uniref:IF factor n=1 Tax=Amazona collaria TaxID=241587 RepID=A0A8B9GF66_9PSIT